jgi:hypothetical protein
MLTKASISVIRELRKLNLCLVRCFSSPNQILYTFTAITVGGSLYRTSVSVTTLTLSVRKIRPTFRSPASDVYAYVHCRAFCCVLNVQIKS